MDSNNFIGLQQFHFTVYSIMNMITPFSILLQLHGILLMLVLLILDFGYLVVLVVASLKSNLERIPKHMLTSHMNTLSFLKEFLKKGDVLPR